MTQLQSRSGGPDGPGDAAGRARWRPRVALVLATSAGGIGAHVRDLAHRLAGAGALVTVCGPEATNDQFRFDARPAPDGGTSGGGTSGGGASGGGTSGGGTSGGAVRFLAVEISTAVHPSDARAVTALRRVLSHAEPDVVHAHGLRAGLVAALAGRGRPGRAPLVVTLHNAVLARGLRGGASRLVERMVVRSADVVLGASADLVARADDAGARDARLGPVSAPPLPPPRRTRSAVRAELGVAEQTPLILSVGRLHPQKGYDVLVEAAARWRERRPSPLVVIAGDGPSYVALTARVSELRAPVALLGHRRDVADLLEAADLAVVSSIWEARQLFTQEALRAGVPLVATAVGGIPDLVGDAVVLVPPGDVDALDRAVRDLLDDPELRERHASLGRDRAATWPTAEQTLAQVWSLYEELARRPPGGGT